MKIFNFNIKILWVDKSSEQGSLDCSRFIEADSGTTVFCIYYICENAVQVTQGDDIWLLTPGDSFIFDDSKHDYYFTSVTHADLELPARFYCVYFHCDKNEKLSALLKSDKISRHSSPPFFELNCKLLDEVIKYNHDVHAVEIWASPFLFQLFRFADEKRSGNAQIERAIDEIKNDPNKKYNVLEMAINTGYSKAHFIRLFKKITGQTPYNYILDAKIDMAKDLLLNSDFNIAQIAAFLGYYDSNHFSSHFKKKTGMCPHVFKNS